MMTARIVQLGVTTATILLIFIWSGKIYYTGNDDLDYIKKPSYITHVTDKVETWLSAGGSRQLIERNEEIYSEMLEQRKGLLKDFEKVRDQGKDDLFPCNNVASYFITPYSVWDFVPASWNCPHSNRRLGRLGDGGKWLCGLEKLAALPTSRPSTQLAAPIEKVPPPQWSTGLAPGQQPGCIIYSLGIQNESSFEEEMMKRTPNCQIWGYDFSVDRFGPALSAYKNSQRAHFTQAGIAGNSQVESSPQYFSIQDLMTLNGHDHIDVLKVDIEGYEFEAMNSLVSHFVTDTGGEVPVAQVLIEIHLDQRRQVKLLDFLGWWEQLEGAGFRPFWTEPNLLFSTMRLDDGMPRYAEYSLLNIKDRKSPFL